jgi:hypothetical protein
MVRTILVTMWGGPTTGCRRLVTTLSCDLAGRVRGPHQTACTLIPPVWSWPSQPSSFGECLCRETTDCSMRWCSCRCILPRKGTVMFQPACRTLITQMLPRSSIDRQHEGGQAVPSVPVSIPLMERPVQGCESSMSLQLSKFAPP